MFECVDICILCFISNVDMFCDEILILMQFLNVVFGLINGFLIKIIFNVYFRKDIFCMFLLKKMEFQNTTIVLDKTSYLRYIVNYFKLYLFEFLNYFLIYLGKFSLSYNQLRILNY